jgi:hypothetical protein
MKLLFGLALGAMFLHAAGINEIKTVYVFPMHNSLDQYLVSRLAQTHTFEVVSDPKLADAVFTDSIGPTFQSAFNTEVLGGKGDASQMPPAFRSSRNTIFLVSKGKRVIWSTYFAARDTSSKQLEKASNQVVAHLQKDLGMGPALRASNSR